MSPTAYRIPNASERELLFAWLKRASSYTGWKLLLDRHKVFSAVVERAFKQDQLHPRPDGLVLIPPGRMSSVFSSEAAFEAALERLRDGDRRCFLFLGTSGHFNQGVLAVTWWRDMDYRERYMSGPAFPPNESPLWPEIEKAIDDFMVVYDELSVVLQSQFTDVPAPIEDLDDYKASALATLAARVPSDPTLARVPTPPPPPIYVKTRQTIPEFGIWEPVVLSHGAYKVDGCMNYLHGGAPAPTIAFAGDGQRKEGRPTVWHLIWPDNRYGPKPIPEEETKYQFGLK